MHIVSRRKVVVNLEDARRRLQRRQEPTGAARAHEFAETEMVLRRSVDGTILRRYRPTPAGWVVIS